KLGAVPGDSRYADRAMQLQGMPRIEVPTITLDGGAHGVLPASDGGEWSASFARHLEHRVVAGAGHNIPQEQPRAFAEAVVALIGPRTSFGQEGESPRGGEREVRGQPGRAVHLDRLVQDPLHGDRGGDLGGLDL